MEADIMICGKCGIEKPIDEFNKEQRWCRSCSNEYMRLWHLEHAKPKQIKPIAKPGYKICTRCREEKPIDDFPQSKSWCLECKRADGRDYYCRNREKIIANVSCWSKKNPDSIRKYGKKRYEKSRDKVLAINKVWRDANPDKRKEEDWRRRALKLGASGDGVGTRQWNAIKEEYCHSCAYCGKREPDIKLTIDHVVPLSKGGIHDVTNVVPACSACNSSKGDRSLLLWMTTIRSYDGK